MVAEVVAEVVAVAFSPVLQAYHGLRHSLLAAEVVAEVVAVAFSPVLQAYRPFFRQPYVSLITRLPVSSACSFSFVCP